jgi:hypothetical protein
MTATARRGHGEGSVYRDAVNGTWVGAISLGWRPDGSRIRRKVTGRTKTEVWEKLKKLQAEADAGLKTSASYAVAKAVDDWAAEALDGLADKLSGHMGTRNGNRPPPVPGIWPSPPTPSSGAATRIARSSRCARRSQSRSATLDASTRTWFRKGAARRPRSATLRSSGRPSAPP